MIKVTCTSKPVSFTETEFQCSLLCCYYSFQNFKCLMCCTVSVTMSVSNSNYFKSKFPLFFLLSVLLQLFACHCLLLISFLFFMFFFVLMYVLSNRHHLNCLNPDWRNLLLGWSFARVVIGASYRVARNACALPWQTNHLTYSYL